MSKALEKGQRLSTEDVEARIREAIDDLDLSDLAELHNKVAKGVIECVFGDGLTHNPYLVVEKTDESDVLICVRGGVGYIESAAPGISVELRDYDVDQGGDGDEFVDEDGQSYRLGG